MLVHDIALNVSVYVHVRVRVLESRHVRQQRRGATQMRHGRVLLPRFGCDYA